MTPNLTQTLRPHLPDWLLFPLPGGAELWQALLAIAAIPLAWVLALLVLRPILAIVARLAGNTSSTLDDQLVATLRGPGRLLVAGLLLRPAWGILEVPEAQGKALKTGLSALVVLALFWGALRAITLLFDRATASAGALARPGARPLLAVAARAARVAVVALGGLTALSELGYPVGSLLAGLGLGGLAFALAAQKTVENLFGAVSLAVDQPFREGDFVRVEDFVGHVELIGMRSTRFRTLDRTLIAIPNGKLADSRLESFAARDRLRLACTVQLVYQTTAAQLRQVLEGLERVLRAHPKIWPEAVVVRFKELGASSLDIEVMAWFQTSDWGEFQLIRQDVLISFMEVVEKVGSSFAYPTQTVHLEAAGPLAVAQAR